MQAVAISDLPVSVAAWSVQNKNYNLSSLDLWVDEGISEDLKAASSFFS